MDLIVDRINKEKSSRFAQFRYRYSIRISSGIAVAGKQHFAVGPVPSCLCSQAVNMS